jgi:uncharacterized FlgJ-related protein
MFNKTFYEGGLTISQVQSLYELNQNRELDRMKFFAKLQGIDIDKQLKKREQENKTLFRDPKDYEDLSDEERAELTQEMMKTHRVVMGSGD